MKNIYTTSRYIQIVAALKSKYHLLWQRNQMSFQQCFALQNKKITIIKMNCTFMCRLRFFVIARCLRPTSWIFLVSVRMFGLSDWDTLLVCLCSEKPKWKTGPILGSKICFALSCVCFLCACLSQTRVFSHIFTKTKKQRKALSFSVLHFNFWNEARRFLWIHGTFSLWNHHIHSQRNKQKHKTADKKETEVKVQETRGNERDWKCVQLRWNQGPSLSVAVQQPLRTHRNKCLLAA